MCMTVRILKSWTLKMEVCNQALNVTSTSIQSFLANLQFINTNKIIT